MKKPATSSRRAMQSRCSVMHPGRESCATNNTRATRRASPRSHVQILPESSPSSAPSLALLSSSSSSPPPPPSSSCRHRCRRHHAIAPARITDLHRVARAPARPLRRAGPVPMGHRNRGRKGAAMPASRSARVMSFSGPSCAITVSYVVGGRVRMDMPCMTRSSWLT